MAAGEPELWRVEVRDGGAPGGEQWTGSDGEHAVPRSHVWI